MGSNEPDAIKVNKPIYNKLFIYYERLFYDILIDFRSFFIIARDEHMVQARLLYHLIIDSNIHHRRLGVLHYRAFNGYRTKPSIALQPSLNPPPPRPARLLMGRHPPWCSMCWMAIDPSKITPFPSASD